MATTTTTGAGASDTTGPAGPSATVDGLGSEQAITIAFAGDMNFEGVLRSRLDADPNTAVRRVDSYRWIPGRISGSVPAPLAGQEAASELSYWNGLRGCAGLDP